MTAQLVGDPDESGMDHIELGPVTMEDIATIFEMAEATPCKISFTVEYLRPHRVVLPGAEPRLPFEEAPELAEVVSLSKNDRLLHGATTIIWRHDRGHPASGSTATPTFAEREAMIGAHPLLVEASDFVQAHRNRNMNPSPMAAAYALIAAVNDSATAQDFIVKVAHGALLDIDSPIKRLREQAEERKRSERKGKPSGSLQERNDCMTELLIHVFNLEAMGKKVKRLRGPKEPGIPEVRRVI